MNNTRSTIRLLGLAGVGAAFALGLVPESENTCEAFCAHRQTHALHGALGDVGFGILMIAFAAAFFVWRRRRQE